MNQIILLMLSTLYRLVKLGSIILFNNFVQYSLGAKFKTCGVWFNLNSKLY